MPVRVGDIITSKRDGDFEVIEYVGDSRFKVRFIKTGYVTTSQTTKVKRGEIRDHYLPFKFGVGYKGDMQGSTNLNGKARKSYSVWHNMLLRCYYEKNEVNGKHNAYKEVSVCEDWHNYSNFHKWFEENYIEGYELDKDMLSGNSKVYSPETCCFLSKAENVDLKKRRSWLVKDPDGNEVVVDNVRQFSQKRGFSAGTFTMMLHGKRKHAWGWTLIKELV
jgi:hypothetical protein